MELSRILAQFGHRPTPADILDLGGAGGFSGARLWRIRAEGQELCLRRWPAEADEEHLRFIHRVLLHAAQKVDFLPAPKATSAGQTLLPHAGHFWELAPWLAGNADFHAQPSPRKLAAALVALAEFHLAAADLAERQPRPSPGIANRLQQLDALLQGGAAKLRDALPRSPSAEFRSIAERTLELFASRATSVRRQLAVAAAVATTLQPCIRDIWHDHVLFVGERVSGIVDFGAMRIESVAGDVARLLGSLAGNDAEEWRAGLSAYDSRRPMSEPERSLIAAFDASTVLLSNMNWLTWILLESRNFDQPAQVFARMRETLRRLEH